MNILHTLFFFSVFLSVSLSLLRQPLLPQPHHGCCSPLLRNNGEQIFRRSSFMWLVRSSQPGLHCCRTKHIVNRTTMWSWALSAILYEPKNRKMFYATHRRIHDDATLAIVGWRKFLIETLFSVNSLDKFHWQADIPKCWVQLNISRNSLS